MRKVAACKEQGGPWGQVDHVGWGSPHDPLSHGAPAVLAGPPSNPETLTPESGHPELFGPRSVPLRERCETVP